jgi:hypothetical protein
LQYMMVLSSYTDYSSFRGFLLHDELWLLFFPDNFTGQMIFEISRISIVTWRVTTCKDAVEKLRTSTESHGYFFGFVIVVMWWHGSHTSSTIHNVVWDTVVRQALTWFESKCFSTRWWFQPFFGILELVFQCTLKSTMDLIASGWYWAWI